MSIRWQKAWLDLFQSKSRTVLVILSIAVGVTAFGSIAGARATIHRDLTGGYLSAHPDSATLYTSGFDRKLVRAVARMPQIAAAEGVRTVRVRAKTPSGDWQTLDLIAVDDFTRMQVNILRPESGAWPPPDREMLVERSALPLLEVAEGERVQIELPDGRTRTLRVAGTVYDGGQIPPPISGVAYGYITADTLPWLGLPPTFDQLQITVAQNPPDAAHIGRVVEQVENKVARSGGRVYWSVMPRPGEYPAAEFLDTILWLLGSVGLLALLLSAFLTINTIQAILVQQVRQIGVMKAIGANTRQVAGIYLRMVLLFGAAALLLALPLGVAGTQLMARFIATQLNFDITSWQLSPQVWLAEIAAGLLVPVLAALYPVVSAAGTTVREAITNVGLSEAPGRTTWIDFLLARLKLSRPLRLSLRNTFRRRGRLALTLLTLTLGGALFVSVLSVRTSLLASLEESLAGQGYDVQVRLSQTVREEKLARLLGGLPGVAQVEFWRLENTVTVDPNGFEKDTVFLYAVPPDTELFEPKMVAGRWLTPDDRDALVLHHTVMERDPTLHLGGTITLKVDGQEMNWRIVGVISDMQPRVSATKAYVNSDYLARQLGDAHRVNLVQIITTDHSAAGHAQMMQAVEQQLNRAGLPVQTIQSATDSRQLMTDRFDVVMTMLGMMSLLVVAVGALGLTGTMSINVLERRREIGVMRAIGASDGAVMLIFLVEGVFIGLMSWLGAMILVQPMSRALSYETGMLFLQTPLVYDFALGAAFLWLAAVVIIGLAASFVPAKNAARLSVREIIAYE